MDLWKALVFRTIFLLRDSNVLLLSWFRKERPGVGYSFRFPSQTCVSGPLLRMAYPSSIMGDAYTVRRVDDMSPL